MIRNLLLVGGDRRALALESLLKADGYSVDTVGLHEGDEATVKMNDAQAALFAYPFSVHNGCIPTMTGVTLHPEDVIRQFSPTIPILLGKGLEKPEGFLCKSYDEDEALLVRNAEISAEAAVMEVMQRTELAVMDRTVTVIGYGRFGRALAQRLKALGAEVWIAARRREQRQLAAEDGMKPMDIAEMSDGLSRAHMVLNTAPAQVMGERELSAIRSGTPILELASPPYGFDREMADRLGVPYEILPALPAKYAPVSAAMALEKAAIRLLEEVQA